MATPSRLARPREPDETHQRPRKRRQQVGGPTDAENVPAQEALRPTAEERQCAERIIDMMKNAAPKISAANRAKPNIIACCLAIHCKEKFMSEKDAKRQFGVGPSTDLHAVWLDDVLQKLFAQEPTAVTVASGVFGPQRGAAGAPTALALPLVVALPAAPPAAPLAAATAEQEDEEEDTEEEEDDDDDRWRGADGLAAQLQGMGPSVEDWLLDFIDDALDEQCRRPEELTVKDFIRYLVEGVDEMSSLSKESARLSKENSDLVARERCELEVMREEVQRRLEDQDDDFADHNVGVDRWVIALETKHQLQLAEMRGQVEAMRTTLLQATASSPAPVLPPSLASLAAASLR